MTPYYLSEPLVISMWWFVCVQWILLHVRQQNNFVEKKPLRTIQKPLSSVKIINLCIGLIIQVWGSLLYMRSWCVTSKRFVYTRGHSVVTLTRCILYLTMCIAPKIYNLMMRIKEPKIEVCFKKWPHLNKANSYMFECLLNRRTL